MAPASFLRLLPVVPRVTQVLFCIVCLASAAATAHTFGKATPGGIGLAVFASVTGLIVSSLLLVTDLLKNARLSAGLTRVFRGLLNFVLSTLWAIFFLSVGAAVAGLGTCKTTTGGFPYIARAATNGRSSASSYIVPAGSSSSGSTGSSSTSSSISGVDASYDDWSNIDWSNTDIYAPGYISDMMAIQHDTTMSVINNIGRKLLLGSAHSPIYHSSTATRQLLASSSSSYKLVCPTWNAVTAMGFMLFVLYTISAVLAVLDMRAGQGLYVPAWLHRGSASVRTADRLPGSDRKTADAVYVLPAVPEAVTGAFVAGGAGNGGVAVAQASDDHAIGTANGGPVSTHDGAAVVTSHDNAIGTHVAAEHIATTEFRIH